MENGTSDIIQTLLGESLVSHGSGNIDAHRMRTLWVAVLLQAIRDANSNINTPQARHEKHHARAWLTVSSRYFNMVCSLAGLDPPYALQRFRAFFQRCDWPE